MGLSSEEVALVRDGCLGGKALSYSPYSKFRVSCCILVSEGGRYTSVVGANVENASYGGTICAERVTITKAMTTAGTRDPTKWIALGIMGDTDECISPCGLCRQVIREFISPKMSPDIPILMFNGDGTNHIQSTMEELLPNSFGPECL
ncbi:This enzyme scavenges exogenous and endogenous cytidine and 2'-deoxycytidine for UMP synthesis [Nakaseomyces bracarensis]|uniref:Cytidine deaminase n=1 Tax=Nakaseomyces bracarensis TaxID=273131 RepID=A0ABR4NZD5_9SACH